MGREAGFRSVGFERRSERVGFGSIDEALRSDRWSRDESNANVRFGSIWDGIDQVETLCFLRDEKNSRYREASDSGFHRSARRRAFSA